MRWAPRADMPKRVGRYGRSKYPWQQIAESGVAGILEEGVDYTSVAACREACYAFAKTHNLRARTRYDAKAGEFWVAFAARDEDG